MKFRALVLELHLPQNFCHTHTDTQTDRHFLEIVKSSSGHPETCKSIENWKSKTFTKPILSSIYVENFLLFMLKKVKMIQQTKKNDCHKHEIFHIKKYIIMNPFIEVKGKFDSSFKKIHKI